MPEQQAALEASPPDEQGRSDFVDLSRRLSATNYASNFDGWGGESFVTLSDEPAARSTILVRTKLVRPTDEDVKFDYRLRKVGDDWRIIDVVVEGVSMAVTQRSEFSSVIASRGGKIDGLLDALRRQIQQADSIAARGRDEAS